MLKTYHCDWCGKEFERLECCMKGKKHAFCSRRCLWDFSDKGKNPNGYLTLRDYTNAAATFMRMNKVTNKTRMTPDVRKKLRESRLNSGEGKTYTKRYGKHEHRVVAEEILGRALLPGEVVHHVDGNKRNNDPLNIRIFESQSAHVKFHAELNWFINELNKMDTEGGDAE